MGEYNNSKRFPLRSTLILLCINGLWAKYYDNSEFDLNPFMDPIGLPSIDGANSPSRVANVLSADPIAMSSINELPLQVQESVDVPTSQNNFAVPYDVQANQLLNYLNSAAALSAKDVNSNTNYVNRPLAIDDKQVTQIVTTTRSLTTVRLNGSDSMTRQRLDSILSQINDTFKVFFDHEKKKYRIDTSVSGHLKKCFNCKDIKNSSECKDIQELEYFELINLFCCQCNADM